VNSVALHSVTSSSSLSSSAAAAAAALSLSDVTTAANVQSIHPSINNF